MLARVLLCALLLSPGAAAVAQSPAYRVYVTNEMSGDLSVIDGPSRQVIATIPVGKRPRGAKLAPDGMQLYVALSGSPIAGPGVDVAGLPAADKKADGIGVVDLRAGRVVRMLRGISDPEQLALSRDGRILFVASEDTGTAVVLNAESGARLTSFAVGGEPEGVTRSPDGRFVYMTSEEDHHVAVIDAQAQRLLKHVPVGKRPRVVAFAPDGSRAYVTGENDASVTVIDTARHEAVHTIRLEDPSLKPMGIAVAPDGRRLYVATGRGGTVVAIDALSYKVETQVKVGLRPWGLALSPDGEYLFTANGPSNDVAVVSTRDMRVVNRIPVGERPWAAVIGPAPG